MRYNQLILLWYCAKCLRQDWTLPSVSWWIQCPRKLWRITQQNHRKRIKINRAEIIRTHWQSLWRVTLPVKQQSFAFLCWQQLPRLNDPNFQFYFPISFLLRRSTKENNSYFPNIPAPSSRTMWLVITVMRASSLSFPEKEKRRLNCWR